MGEHQTLSAGTSADTDTESEAQLVGGPPSSLSLPSRLCCDASSFRQRESKPLLGVRVCRVTAQLCRGHKLDVVKETSFVQFFLENGLQLWGEDIPSLWGERVATPDEGDVTSNREGAAGCVNHVSGFGEKDSKAARAHGRRLDSAVLEPKSHPKSNDFHLLQVRDAFIPS
ncbi:hypothetical protein CB1_000394003 [Camelus ferus]|nr:hypothetical protein CB1_000394003 [Camelus ferus]